MQTIPTFVPTVSLEGATQIEDAFSAGFCPEHAGVLKALTYDRPATGFDDSGAAEQPGLAVSLVEHTMLMVLKVSDLRGQGVCRRQP